VAKEGYASIAWRFSHMTDETQSTSSRRAQSRSTHDNCTQAPLARGSLVCPAYWDAGSLSGQHTMNSTTTSTNTSPGQPVTNIVLVHGAFADGNCWGHVIAFLERNGHRVTAVQNAMTTFADDIATTKRVIDAQKGPVVVVGHSYGGAVITGASVDSPNVKALVYIAAFGPDRGETLGKMYDKYPAKLVNENCLTPDAAGFLYIARSKFKEAFAADVPDTERGVMAATQRPIAGSIFNWQFSTPGWRTIPSWYLVATQDNAINPDLQRMYARRMNATIVEVESSHVSMISHPADVAELIELAARATTHLSA
jgi:pimeloyl-ACP methyl ester carboxylesterase